MPFLNLDAGESIFFARQLEYVKQYSFDILYPEYKATKYMPVSTEAGPGAETIVYREFDTVGIMKIISNYATDLPRVDVVGKEYRYPVRSIAGEYGYNIQEVRASRFAGAKADGTANKPLEVRRGEAARRAYEQAVNRIGWFAKSDDGVNGGLTGLLYQPNITHGSLANGDWMNVARTTDQIIYDMTKAVWDMIDLTKGVETPDTVLLPISQFGKISSTPRSTISDTTILTFLKENLPFIKTWDWVNELKAVSPKPSAPTNPLLSTSVMALYRVDPLKLTFEIPQPFEQFPVQERGLEYLIPTHARIGGVIVYYPLSVALYENI
jgi:hypothetical protein